MAGGPYIDPEPPRDLVERLKERFADAVEAFTEFRGELTVHLVAGRLVEICRHLRDDPESDFSMLTGLVGMHFLERDYEHELAYQLYSVERNHRLRLTVRLAPGETVPSVTSVWPGAEYPEREVFDLVGVRFEGHPDLRRIFMPDDYPDHPLRKDLDVEGGPSSLDLGGRPASRGYRKMEHA